MLRASSHGYQGTSIMTHRQLLASFLLVATFAFNFNNFGAIYLLTEGGPFSADNPNAGGTDILISYVYNLAFAGSRGVNYGFASAITIIIFFIVGAITLFQFRYTRMWEEVSENV